MKNKIEDLRDHLFATLESLRDDEKPMEIERAFAISEVAGKIIESAKTEVMFIKATGARSGSAFFPADRALPAPAAGEKDAGNGGTPGVTVHRIK